MRECEEILKIVQISRDLRLDRAGGLRLASRQKLHTCQACQKLKRHASWTKSTDWPFGYLAARTHDLVKLRVQAANQLYFEKPDSSHSILTLV